MPDDFCRSFTYCYNRRAIQRFHFNIHTNSKLWCWGYTNVRFNHSRWISWRSNTNVRLTNSNVWRIWIAHSTLWITGKMHSKLNVNISAFLCTSKSKDFSVYFCNIFLDTFSWCWGGWIKNTREDWSLGSNNYQHANACRYVIDYL